MSDLAYEKIATRARELLAVRPRPTTQDVADGILGEVAAEFEVPASRQAAFVERLRPAMMTVVGSARSKLIRDLEEEAARAYLAKPIPSAEPPAKVNPRPAATAPAHALGAGMDGQSSCDDQDAPAVPAPEPGASDVDATHTSSGAPAPASGGHRPGETHTSDAAPPEPGRADGDHVGGEAHHWPVAPSAREPAANRDAAPTHPSPPAPVTPLSLRQEHLDGWRPLRDELLYVPEYPDVTYGSATAAQRQRAMTYYHSVGMGWVAKARRMRVLDEAIKAAGVETLADLLDGRALAGRES